MKDNILIAILTSTALSTILGTLLQMVSELIKNRLAKSDRKMEIETNERKEMYDKKEAAYTKALSHMLMLRNIIDNCREKENVHSIEVKELIDKANKVALEVGPLIQLYAPKHAFLSYRRVNRYIKILESDVKITDINIRVLDSESDFFVKIIKEDMGLE